MKRYCVVYMVCGMHYRFRGYYSNKREARRDCREATGISNRDIVEIYEED